MKCLVFSQERYIRAQSHKPRHKSMILVVSSSGCDQCHCMTKRAVQQILLAITWNSSAKFPWSPIVWKMPTCLKTLAFYPPNYSETSKSAIQSGYRTITSKINVCSYLQLLLWKQALSIFTGRHCHSASSLRVLADKSVSSLRTTGYFGNLLPIKKRLLVHHCIPFINQCHFHSPISHTKHIFPLQHFPLT